MLYKLSGMSLFVLILQWTANKNKKVLVRKLCINSVATYACTDYCMNVCMYGCKSHTHINTYIQSVCASIFIVHTGKQVIEEASSSNMD